MRLFFLQVLQGQRYRELSEGNRIRVEVLTAPRGEVRDRKVRLLEDCVPSFTVTLDPFDKAYPRNPAHIDSTLATLGQILGVDPTLLKEKIQRERKVSFLPIRLKRNVDIKSVAFVSEHRDQLPGVEVESEPLRRYPLGLMASHLLGYVGEISDKELLDPQYGDYLSGDLIGRMGIDRRYEKILRGQDGKRFLEVNALGRKAELLGDKHPIVPRRGVDLELTIDLDVQRAAEEAFAPGARGAVVALDPRNGEVLALASKPNYDPNEVSAGINPPQERRGLFQDRAWYDRRFGTGRWSRGLTLNVAIGQGEVSLTPVKLAQLAAFVGNGGVLWKPHLVRSVASGASAQAYDSLRQVVPVSPYNLEAVRSAMASVVSDPNGTGGQARLDLIPGAGKTGTAQNPHEN